MKPLQDLSLRTKLDFSLSAFFLPMAVLFVLLVQLSMSNIQSNEQEVRGARLARPLYALLTSLPPWAVAEEDRAQEIDALWKEADQLLTEYAVALRLSETEMLASGKDAYLPEKLRKEWQLLRETTPGSPERLTATRALESGLIGLMSYASDTSNLTLDPDLDSYYTMNATMFQVPAFLTRLTSLSFAPAEARLLISQIDLPGIEGSFRTVIKEDSRFMGPIADLDTTLDKLLGNLLSLPPQTEAPAFREAADALWKQANLYLEQMCQARVDRYTRDLTVSVAVSALVTDPACMNLTRHT